ncbi:hypothetical protein BD309DRAFT_959198 [Dichomitus squalens]|nr:hypothetical protein BD309DRAFT_959198 [Dichomitus squalens]
MKDNDVCSVRIYIVRSMVQQCSPSAHTRPRPCPGTQGPETGPQDPTTRRHPRREDRSTMP